MASIRAVTLGALALLPVAIGCGGQDALLPNLPLRKTSASLNVCTKAPTFADEVAAPQLALTLPGSWDEGWGAAPALVDLDGDGKLEIIAARHSVLAAWNAAGTQLWQTAFGHEAGSSPAHGDRRMWPSPVVGDFDGNGSVEIAVASAPGNNPDSNLAIYDSNGHLASGWPQKFGSGDEIRSLAAADVTGDGRLELLAVKTGDNPATAVFNFGGSMMPGWPQITDSCNPAAPARPCYAFGGYNQNIGAADMDSDGVDDVVSSTDTIYLGIFKGSGAPLAAASGFAPKVVPSVPAYHDPAEAKQGWGTKDRSEFTDSPPVMADLDGSGKPRLVLLGDHEHAESTLFRGHTLWVLNGDMSRPAGWEWPKDMGAPLRRVLPDHNIVMQLPQPSVGELDGEPGVEILAPASDGKLHVYHSDGTPYWSFTFGTQESPYIGASEVLVADINGDGVPEVLFTTFVSGAPGAPEATPRLYVLSSSGAVLHAIALSGRGSMAAPSVADLDGDGQLELVISLKDSVGNGKGGVQIWNLPGSSKNCVQWATARGNWLRTGTPGLK